MAVGDKAMKEQGAAKRFIRGFNLFLIITAGVAAGNMLSGLLTTVISLAALSAMFSKPMPNQPSAAIQQPTTHQQTRPRIQTPSQAVEQITRETKRKRQISDQLNRTCDFWISEYRKTQKALDKAHRDVACRDAGRPFNR